VIVHGIDIVDVAHFGKTTSVMESGGHVFLPAELSHVADDANRIERLAARFAIKEAVLKALGTGLGDGYALRDVEVTTNDRGAPGVVLHGLCANRAASMGIVRWLVSCSHNGLVAIGSVIGTGP
jgi:holo-[acyl-carrier protein] synthase